MMTRQSRLEQQLLRSLCRDGRPPLRLVVSQDLIEINPLPELPRFWSPFDDGRPAA